MVGQRPPHPTSRSILLVFGSEPAGENAYLYQTFLFASSSGRVKQIDEFAPGRRQINALSQTSLRIGEAPRAGAAPAMLGVMAVLIVKKSNAERPRACIPN